MVDSCIAVCRRGEAADTARDIVENDGKKSGKNGRKKSDERACADGGCPVLL